VGTVGNCYMGECINGSISIIMSRRRFFQMLQTQQNVSTLLIEATAFDSILNSQSLWDDARNGPTGVIYNGRQWARAYLAGPYRVARTYALFNFSSIVGTVTAADLLISNGATNDGNNIIAQFCDNTGTLVEGDFDNFSGDFGNGGAVESIEVAPSTFLIVKIIPLNNSGLFEINQKINTRFCIRDYNYDYLNIAPITSESGAAIYPVYIRLTINS
jgi:hypothetical protein